MLFRSVSQSRYVAWVGCVAVLLCFLLVLGCLGVIVLLFRGVVVGVVWCCVSLCAVCWGWVSGVWWCGWLGFVWGWWWGLVGVVLCLVVRGLVVFCSCWVFCVVRSVFSFFFDRMLPVLVWVFVLKSFNDSSASFCLACFCGFPCLCCF